MSPQPSRPATPPPAPPPADLPRTSPLRRIIHHDRSRSGGTPAEERVDLELLGLGDPADCVAVDLGPSAADHHAMLHPVDGTFASAHAGAVKSIDRRYDGASFRPAGDASQLHARFSHPALDAPDEETPMRDGRTSASMDFPVRAPREFRDAEPGFSELLEARGSFVGACLSFAARFIRRNYGILIFFVLLQIGLALLGIFAFDPLPWKAWVAFGIVSVALSLLIVNALPTEVVMLTALVAMLLFEIVTPSQALEGFSNTGVAAVAVLFIVAEGIQRTSVLMPLFRVILGKPDRLWAAQLRLMLPVAVISAFLNNTPVVAMLISVVQTWSRRAGFPVSKLLMPLNNAAILGGTVTLLGTSTNLVVKGLAESEQIEDQDGNVIVLSLFGISRIGIILLGIGIVYMLIASRFLLKDRGSQGVAAIAKNPREYTVPLLVTDRSPIVDETVTSAGLRQLQGLYLVEVTRADGEVIPAVPPETKILAGDTLLFAGVVETVTELYHIPGIVPATNQSTKMTHERHRRRLVELVISPSSFLCGKTAKEARFRSRFDSAIIAVHRRGEHVKEKIADIRFYAGDTLLVETSSNFIKHYSRDSNFALVSEVSGSQPPRTDILHMVLSAIFAILMISVVTADKMDLLTAAGAAALLMIATGCLSLSNASGAVNLPVILTIASSFGVSKGMEVSGAANALALFIVDAFKSMGTIGLLFGIYIGTALLSSVLTNNAAVSLYFPVITGILRTEKTLNPLAALYTLMIGASSSFSTPIGYQTNMMVHGPGGYTFTDWIIFGVPLQILLGAAGVFSINQFFPSS